jgi:hypothetical protein
MSFFISGFEAVEGRLFKIVFWSMHHGGMLSSCFFPLHYELSLAMGISIRVIFSLPFPMRILGFEIVRILSGQALH